MTVLKVANAEEGIKVAYQHILNMLAKSERVSMALSGGSTPRALYQQLDQYLAANAPLLQKLHICWVDERVVPFDSHRSNYGNTMKDWNSLQHIRHVPFPVHEHPSVIANSYKLRLAEAGMIKNNKLDIDISILGMGDDGHTASVFPGIPVQYTNDYAGVCYHESFGEWRATLTLNSLKHSKQNIALVFGKDKLTALKDCIEKKQSYPFSELIQDNMLLITDQDA